MQRSFNPTLTPCRAILLALFAASLNAKWMLAETRSAETAKPAIENIHPLTPQLISGGQPKGDAAFSQLAEMGVKTIVSVDGAKPDLELAKKHGLRYVHIPIGYDGVGAEAESQGQGPDDAQYVVIDAAGQQPGLYLLTLRVRDRVSGRSVEKTTEVMLE